MYFAESAFHYMTGYIPLHLKATFPRGQHSIIAAADRDGWRDCVEALYVPHDKKKIHVGNR